MAKIKRTNENIKQVAVGSKIIIFDENGYADVSKEVAEIKSKFFKVVANETKKEDKEDKKDCE